MGIPKDPVGSIGRLGGMDESGVASTSVVVTVATMVEVLFQR